MRKVKNFIIGSSFVVLLSGSTIALAAEQRQGLGYSAPIVASHQQQAESKKQKTVKKKNPVQSMGKEARNWYGKKMEYKKKELKQKHT